MPFILSKHNEVASQVRDLMPDEAKKVGGGLSNITSFLYTRTSGNDTMDDGSMID